MNIRTMIFILVFALGVSSGPALADTVCENHLVLSLAQVTKSSLGKRQIYPEDVREMMDSPVPLHPLRYRTNEPSISNLRTYYTTMLAHVEREGGWDHVRAQLKQILEENDRGASIHAVAKRETERVIYPKLMVDHQVRALQDVIGLEDGRILLTVRPHGSQEIELRELFSENRLFGFESMGQYHYSGEFERGDDGSLLIADYSNEKGGRLLRLGMNHVDRKLINPWTGNFKTDSIWFFAEMFSHYRNSDNSPYGRHRYLSEALVQAQQLQVKTHPGIAQVFKGGKPLHETKFKFFDNREMVAQALLLRDGRFVLTGFEKQGTFFRQRSNFLRYFAPARDGGGKVQMIEAAGHIRGVQVVETSDSRILVLVKSDYPRTLEIFEPEAGAAAIHKVTLEERRSPTPHFWEHNNKFYFAYEVHRYDDSGLMDVEVHEIFDSKGVVATMSIPEGQINIVERNGQSYLISQPRGSGGDSGGIQVYSLFNIPTE